mmetsp:Transcript_130682/g.310020  ORF Transcript_130682/g.310020 Transcript_130682/m.310020 type:complete len:257 (+) Transcript_130682:59-829(+)
MSWMHEENRACQYASILACVATAAVASIIVYAVGPTTLLAEALRMLPDDPGWGWFIGWALVLLISIVLMLPMWQAVCIASGLMFGLGYGTALNFLALYGAAAVSTLLGETLLREPIRRWLAEYEATFPGPMKALKCLERAEDSLEVLILFRFLFIPIWLRNYAPTTLQVETWKLLVAALPHSLWVSFIFASLGVSLQDAEQMFNHGAEFQLYDMKWQHILMFAVSCLTSLLISLYAYRKYVEMTSDEAEHLVRKEP